jgi:dihydroflavonol-4-reductase
MNDNITSNRLVLVTGASGHLGSNLVRQLLDKGYEVRCLVRKDTRGIDGLQCEMVIGDVTDSASLSKAVKGCDIVFHCAAAIGVEGKDTPMMMKINVEGTRNMLRAAEDEGVRRFIHFSSLHALCMRPTSDPLHEDRPLELDPKAHPYNHTKALAEQSVLEACERGLSATILSPTGILGPWDTKPSRMGEVLDDFARGAMPALLRTGFDWVDVRDVCNSSIAAIDHGRAGERYLLPGKWASFATIARAIHAADGHRPPRMTIPLWLAYVAVPFAAIASAITGNRARFSRGSLYMLRIQCRDIPGTKAAQELGHTCRDLTTTIQDALVWQRAHRNPTE